MGLAKEGDKPYMCKRMGVGGGGGGGVSRRETERGGRRKEDNCGPRSRERETSRGDTRTAEPLARGTRLLLLLQMVGRRFQQIDVSL